MEKTYKLIVLQIQENPGYEEQMAKYKSRDDYGMNRMRNYDREFDPLMPTKETAVRSLEVFLTEEEYKTVKKGVIDTFN